MQHSEPQPMSTSQPEPKKEPEPQKPSGPAEAKQLDNIGKAKLIIGVVVTLVSIVLAITGYAA
jgi:hypothetical protein